MGESTENWPGVAADRIVGVLAILDNAKVQVGSGYLLAADRVLTARHCVRDKLTGRPATSLRIVRLSDGATGDARIAAGALDICVLRISWADRASLATGTALDTPVFGRISRDHAAQLQGCQAAGVPLWQVKPGNHNRQMAEVHGHIRAMEGRESGRLIMRDPLLADVGVPDGVSPSGNQPAAPWGGLSGALAFYAGYALGVIVEHEPWLGAAALTILPVERIAEAARKGDAEAAAVMSELGFSPPLWALPRVALPQADTAGQGRLCLGVRAEGHPLPTALQEKLSWIIVAALHAAGVDAELCARQDELGGRHVITLPAQVHLASTVPALVRGIELAARDANASSDAAQRVRLAVAVAYGHVRPRAAVHEGPAVTEVVGMLDAAAMRDRLRLRRDAAVAFAFSDELYRLICSQAPAGFSPADFRPLGVAQPGLPQGSEGWLYAPAGGVLANTVLNRGSSSSSGSNVRPAGSEVGTSTSANMGSESHGASARGLVFAFGAIPPAGAARWLYTHHGVAHPSTPTPPDFTHTAVAHQIADLNAHSSSPDTSATWSAFDVDPDVDAGHGAERGDHQVPDPGVHHVVTGPAYSADWLGGDGSVSTEWGG